MKRWTAALLGGLLAPVYGCSDDIAVGNIERGDVFYQGGGHVVVDVLWVIDDSGTMTEEQSALQSSLAPFIEALLEADIDFHLGVVTTDVSDPDTAGVLRGEPSILTRDTPDLMGAFSSAAIVGVSGNPSEQGFAAVQLALSEPLLTGANTGFLRSDAELAVIVISDEDDHSDLSVQDFKAFLSDVKSESSWTLSAVVGDVPYGCASISGAADPANRYLQVVQETGGESQSICSSSYAPIMSRLVQLLSHIQDTYPLSQIPDPDTITVTVDGVTIRERDVDGWQYLPASNAVRISGTPLPDPGQEVRIIYDNYRF